MEGGNKILFLLLTLVAGYIFVSNYTLTKSTIARSNGQHLYLKISMCGLAFFVIAVILQKHIFNSEYGTLLKILNFLPGSFIENDGADSIFEAKNWLTYTAATACELSILALLLLEGPIWLWRFLQDRPELYDFFDKETKCPFLNKVMLVSSSLWLSIEYVLWQYVKFVEKYGIRNNASDLLLWEILLSDDDIVMTCDDGGKVFIGFMITMPNPKQATNEQSLAIAPLMSGSLCKDFQQLHITTDYTDSFTVIEDETSISEHSESNVTQYLKKLRYLRRFDTDMFDDMFRKKTCACGHDIYLPKAEKYSHDIILKSKENH
ncbi:hypothetical protein [Cobetia marina]|uniref:hypothetical protein n=1 Tax=Cobetia marina TaxID=28258 RepID=UPI00384D5D5E